MAKNLVIVESPAKVKTIKKFLGKNYEVMASNGHVRDLPKTRMGIKVEDDYEPEYITIRGKGDLLAELRKEAAKADKVYLATDPDREGEAISWHLMTALKLDPKKTFRISFNEITKPAVTAAIKSPRELDMGLVDAQQARRVLDRLVGYQISPLLWKKVKRGLSAGRVQSVALRIICDREDEINAFIPKEYWTLEANFKADGEKKPFVAKFYGDEKGKLELGSEAEVDKVIKAITGQKATVSEVKNSSRIKKSPMPFTTSTMQQEAAKALGFTVSKTMRVAQQLYQGVSVKGRGNMGLITYLRTDSVRVSDEAMAASKAYIGEKYGEAYLGGAQSAKKTGSKIQDAHEAIRPADITLTPDEAKDSLTRDQFRLYQLIWKRFVASRMKEATYATTSIKISVGGYVFTMAASKLTFDGFLSVYRDADDKEEKNLYSGSLNEKDVLSLDKVDKTQHFTQPPAHFTEASLVRTLEEIGVGRPSTYAPTISTIQKRRYVTLEGKNIFVTEMGEAVNGIMKDSFASIVDEHFTANMEALLDSVELKNIEWKSLIENFYPDLHASVVKAEEELEKIEIRDEETDVVCEECGRNMVIRYSIHGKFLACPGFPECRNTKTYLERVGVSCPKCGKDVVYRTTRKGRRYFGCEAAPECDFMSWSRPLEKKCPNCGGYMTVKGKKAVCADEKCGYSEDLPEE